VRRNFLLGDASVARSHPANFVCRPVTERTCAANTVEQGTGLGEEHLRGLLLRGLAGDAAAYHAFLKELGARLRAFFRRRLARLPEEVEDLVQESLLAVHLQRHTYDSEQPLMPWVYALARYKLIDLLRRRARTDLLHDPLDENDELLGTFDSEAAEARRDIAKLLEALPDRQRLPILYVKLEGLSVAEAARCTGMSESAVKVGVHRGLKALAAKLRTSS
jgi:RNA polymerase sigma-70 factor, ECF subfamily